MRGRPVVFDDTLTALMAADPVSEDTPRELPAKAYDGVFDAWEIARRHVYEEWQRLADGTALLPDVPKALRDAAQLVYEHGEALGVADQQELLARLNTAPPTRTERAIREVLKQEVPPRERVIALKKLVDEAGLQAPAPPPDLRPVDDHDIRLVAWMAVSTEDMTASD